MELNKENIIDAIGHCVGYGPEEAKYFFWGLEEKGKINLNDYERNQVYVEKFNESKGYFNLTNEEIYSRCKECEEKDQKDIKNSKTLWTFAKFFNALTNNEIESSKIGSTSKPIMIGNLGPFGKDKTNDQYDVYLQNWIYNNGIKREAYLIKLLHDNAENNLVFCFGDSETYKSLFKKYYEITFSNNNFFQHEKRYSMFYKAQSLNLFILAHPRSLMASEEQIDKFIKHVI